MKMIYSEQKRELDCLMFQGPNPWPLLQATADTGVGSLARRAGI
jgi:hypothetical protein